MSTPMNPEAAAAEPLSRFARISQVLMAGCLGVMAVAVFVNVVLRYGFGSGIAASEELSRLLFVWMVFIGAAAAYPAGGHRTSRCLRRSRPTCRRLASNAPGL